MSSLQYDVIVVGAGHAGIEAASASARLGLKTLMVTLKLDRVGFMSCNPSIGGLAKGHMVKELAALGGQMPLAADYSCVQFKRLNARKGPAVRGSRAQCDKDIYCDYMGSFISNLPNLDILQSEVSSLLLNDSKCQGVVLVDGSRVKAHSVVITTGTFMNAVMHIGDQKIQGGRVGDKATVGISDQLREFGFTVTRLKTGTPPRLFADSIDWSKTAKQYGDDIYIPFSYKTKPELRLPQIHCFLAHTNERTHQIIRDNLDKSPMFTGAIEGIGPRYCPSIEDKITRFADKAQHQTFLEPEGINSQSIYLQGISTSLPEDVQLEFLQTISGLENVKIIRPGYAVEYDFIEPTQIQHTLETRTIENLYFAGQINGTSGYEEAAVQGLVAGTNAALKILAKDSLIFGRDEAYIGVLIDDLVTKGTREPYRMMTSRAEFRLVLREDNALDRLYQRAFDLGLLPEEDYMHIESIMQKRQSLHADLCKKVLVPNQETQQKLLKINTPVIQKPTSLEVLLRRKEITCLDLKAFELRVPDDRSVWEPVEIQIKYQGYIQRQNQMISQAKKLEDLRIPADINYTLVRGLSREEVEKLSQIKPLNLGQAQRISGVNPSAIQALLVFLKGHKSRERKFESSH